MGHEKHLVEGIILDSSNFGESGRIIKILTSDFGVMTMVATGVRELKSKMRPSLEVLNLADFEFVEGKEMNRLVGVFLKEKFSENLTRDKRRVVSNVVNFILRTVVGEIRNEKLWNSFLEGVRFVGGGGAGEARAPELVEIIWLIKILVALGYWVEGKIDSFTLDNFVYLSIENNKKETIDSINLAIKSTHL